jgi:polysaccharide export outer membrane protein
MPLAHAEGEDGYRIQAGDVLVISVWKEEGLEREVLVRPDGGFSFPLVGDLQANGKTTKALNEEIAGRLERYIPDPVVTLAIRQILGNKIYVIGKVNNPGEFIVNPDVDVMQALSKAGGMNPFAASNSIKILRRVNGKQQAIPFRYGDVEDG